MILSTHHFWCHIPRSPRCVFLVLRVPDTSDTEVSDPKVAILVKYEILRLDVTVDNALVMNIFKSLNDTGSEEF